MQSPKPVRRSRTPAEDFAQKTLPSSLKIDLKALMLLFRTLYKSFVGLKYFWRYCGLKFKHQIFGCIQKFPPPFRVKSAKENYFETFLSNVQCRKIHGKPIRLENSFFPISTHQKANFEKIEFIFFWKSLIVPKNSKCETF